MKEHTRSARKARRSTTLWLGDSCDPPLNTHAHTPRAGLSSQAFSDYQRTEFGRWPWASDAPVHPRAQPRFARFPDGRTELPGGEPEPKGEPGGGPA